MYYVILYIFCNNLYKFTKYLYNVIYITNIGEYDMIFDEDIDKLFKHMYHEFVNIDNMFDDSKSTSNFTPYYYGYTVTIGPNGKPITKEYGNMKPNLLSESIRNPLVDKIVNDKVVKLIAEMPGLEKNDIKIHIENNMLEIKGERNNKKYKSTVKITEKIDTKSSTATYTNGILELQFDLLKTNPKNKSIRIS